MTAQGRQRQAGAAPGSLLVGCDGSCLENPGGATGWAWAAEDGSWSSGCQPSGTNQVAELWGVLSVLRDFASTPLVVQIDSVYAMKAATVWRQAWRRNGWRTSSGGAVQNLALIRAIDLQMEMRDVPVQFQKVPGHDRQNRWPLNTAADKHAGQAARWAQRNHRTGQFRDGRQVA